MKCLIYYYHSMNWSLYSSCICVVVPVHLSRSMFIFILCTCYICYTQVNKGTWTFKTRDSHMGRSGGTLRGQWCWVFESHPKTGCHPATQPAFSVSAPGSAPGHTNGSKQDGDLPKVEVNMDVLGRAACSPHPISSHCLPELRAGGWCVCKHAHAWENTGEPTTNWQRKFHGLLLLHL